MGFFITGYPTFRSKHRNIADQLPPKLRTKYDVKYFRFCRDHLVSKQSPLAAKKLKDERRALAERPYIREFEAEYNEVRQKRKEHLAFEREVQMYLNMGIPVIINGVYRKKKTKPQLEEIAREKERRKNIKYEFAYLWNYKPYYIVKKFKYIPIYPTIKKKKKSKQVQPPNWRDFIELEKQYIKPSIRKPSKKNKRKRKRSKDSDDIGSSKKHKKSKKKDKKSKKKDKKSKKKDKKSRKEEPYHTPEYDDIPDNTQDNRENIIPHEHLRESVIKPVREPIFEKHTLPKSLSIVNLPPEIIQKIFVYSSANYNLLLVNKYFNHCLQLTDTLLGKNLFENYLIDLNVTESTEDNEGNDINDNDNIETIKHFLHINIFEDRIMINFLIRNFQNLDNEFENFITDDLIAANGKDYKIPFLPHILYVDYIDSLFHNIEFLEFLFDKFEIHVDTLVDHVIHWFFTQKKYRIQDLLAILDVIKESCQTHEYLQDKVNFTAHHLVSILEFLFLKEDRNKSINEREFYQGICDIVDNFNTLSIDQLKLKFIDIYLLTFYKFSSNEGETEESDINTVLDDSLLWDCLRKISNIELLDMFVARGVRPSYGDII